MADKDVQARQIHIDGIVQGVGFRPFVYGLAERFTIKGWVINTSAGVDIHAEASGSILDAFSDSLSKEAPPLARIDAISVSDAEYAGFTAFEIRHSEAMPGAFQPISPDVSLCEDCLHELFDPDNRRYRYPFINCTNCGPRFTIIKDIPYDRPMTTMAPFVMCDDCRDEYEDPADRRFHAQPVACPVCGPQVWLETSEERIAERDDAILNTIKLLHEGKIIAIKGLGGFHLACDAANEDAVAELRRRKLRREKPFALMMRDNLEVKRHCEVSPEEEGLLESRERPIVILSQKPGNPIAPSAAPGQITLGVMLPYAPLHSLIFDEDEPMALVMTSGNLSEEPIATENGEARERLAGIADAFLMHDRDIHIRTDDSVMRIFEGHEMPIRRSRGYAPFPVRLPQDGIPVLAAGGELKNTFCVTRDKYAFLSHHIGDMENLETLGSFEKGVKHFEGLFRIRPKIIACDMHPDYLASRYAEKRAEAEDIPLVNVQHHHAHIAALMAEHGLSGERPIIGVAFDGTGYGADGAIWGGEFLIADYRGYERVNHLKYIQLPGGDTATKKVARIAIAHLLEADILLDDDLFPVKFLGENEVRITAQQVEKRLNAPLTSSMGRLFDAAAALAGVRGQVNYEGQAAIEFEALADLSETGAYSFAIGDDIDPGPVFAEIVRDIRAGLQPSAISARFHRGLADMIRGVCVSIHRETGLNEVGLSGGVFQNVTLTRLALQLLRAEGFTIYTHRIVPTNDGGIALGQATVARATTDDI